MKVRTRRQARVTFEFGDKVFVRITDVPTLVVIVGPSGTGPEGNPIYNATTKDQGTISFDPATCQWEPVM